MQTVKAMAEVKVVRRWSRPGPANGVRRRTPVVPARPRRAATRAARWARDACGTGGVRLVAVGASTGGPLVLQTHPGQLPSDFAAPVVIVQHIAAGFLPGLAEWLSARPASPSRVAAHGEPLLPGARTWPPTGCTWASARGTAPDVLATTPPDAGLRPSVAHLFASVAESFGADAAGVLLTGMGRDGAAELNLMRRAGALTVAQDRELPASCSACPARPSSSGRRPTSSPRAIAALWRRRSGGRNAGRVFIDRQESKVTNVRRPDRVSRDAERYAAQRSGK